MTNPRTHTGSCSPRSCRASSLPVSASCSRRWSPSLRWLTFQWPCTTSWWWSSQVHMLLKSLCVCKCFCRYTLGGHGDFLNLCYGYCTYVLLWMFAKAGHYTLETAPELLLDRCICVHAREHRTKQSGWSLHIREWSRSGLESFFDVCTWKDVCVIC